MFFLDIYLLVILACILRNYSFSFLLLLQVRMIPLLYTLLLMKALGIGLGACYILPGSRLMKPSRTSYQPSVSLGLHKLFLLESVVVSVWTFLPSVNAFNFTQYSSQFGSYLWGGACHQPFSLYS